jgi:hypothetical protein
MLLPRVLRVAAAAVVAVPLAVAAIGQCVIWLLPDCNPNPYAIEGCLVGSHSIAAGLVLVTTGGVVLALLGTLLSVLLLLVATWVSRK